MIKFKEVDIENFMSIGKVKVDLDVNGFTLVSAINNRVEDSAKSNGSGKSSIGESIVWALTGETIRGYKEVINRYTEGPCTVSLSFDFKGHSWLIKRSISRAKDKTLEIVKDGLKLESKGIRDAGEVLTRELPELTFKFLNSVVILGQGLPGRFTNNSPSGRKAVLEELTNADFMITQIKEKISRRGSALSLLQRSAQDFILKGNTQKDLLSSILKSNREREIEVSKFDIKKATEEREEVLIKGKLARETSDNLKAELEILQGKMKVLLNSRTEVVSKYSESTRVKVRNLGLLKESEKEENENKFKQDLEELTDSIRKIDQKISSLTEEIGNLKAMITDGKCTKCGQELPGFNQSKIDELKEEISEKEKLLGVSRLLANSGAIQKEGLIAEKNSESQKISKKFLELENEIITNEEKLKLEELKETDLALFELSKEERILKEKEATSNDLVVRLRIEYSSVGDKIAGVVKTKAIISEEILEGEKKLKELEEALIKKNLELEEVQDRIRVNKSMETFASRDFRGILLEEVIARLDTILKGYAGQVYGNQLTKFYQEGNAITVEFDGKEYESLSGGEQQKLNVLLQLSLRDLIIELTGVTGSFLLLDEIFDGLDSFGCEKMVNLFQTLETSVFIITHHEELNLPWDYKLTVVKETDGVAHVEVG